MARKAYEIRGIAPGGTKKGTGCHPLMTVRRAVDDGQRRTEPDRK